jgi:hypothetical protein
MRIYWNTEKSLEHGNTRKDSVLLNMSFCARREDF